MNQEKDPEFLGCCPTCGEVIYAGFEHVKYPETGDVYCDLYCFAKHMGAEEVY